MNVSDIPLREKPSHGSIKRVQNIENEFLLMKMGINGFSKFVGAKKKGKSSNGTSKDDSGLMNFISKENSDLIFEFISLQDSIGEYQTIMLPTSWNLKKILEFEEEATEEEYQTLLKRCIETLGGTAVDFFRSSHTGSSYQVPEEKKKEAQTP